MKMILDRFFKFFSISQISRPGLDQHSSKYIRERKENNRGGPRPAHSHTCVVDLCRRLSIPSRISVKPLGFKSLDRQLKFLRLSIKLTNPVSLFSIISTTTSMQASHIRRKYFSSNCLRKILKSSVKSTTHFYTAVRVSV